MFTFPDGATIARRHVHRIQDKYYDHAIKNPESRYEDLENLTRHPDVLLCAWRHVVAASHAAGLDGVRVPDLVHDERDALLAELADDLANGKYNPTPARGCLIGQRGKRRLIGIPTVRDRVAQTAIRFIVEPIVDARLSRGCFAFRRGMGPHSAVDDLYGYMSEPNAADCFVKFDVADAFGSVDLRLLLRQLQGPFADRKLMRRLDVVLRAGTVFAGRLRRKGLVQGAPLSPLLFNMYLSALDGYLESRGIPFWRYADDVVLAAGDHGRAAALLSDIRGFLLDALGMRICENKTAISTPEDGVDLVGYRLQRVGTRLEVHVAPGGLTRLARLFRNVIESGPPDSGLSNIIGALNASSEGWRSYFCFAAEDIGDVAVEVLGDRLVDHRLRVTENGRLVAA